MNTTVSPRRAFTLIELLVVITIILIMMALMVPAFTNIARASQISATAQMVVDSFNLARQSASTQNRRVEVRFYQLAEDAAPSRKVYRAMQLFLIQPTGLQPLTRVLRFPGSVVMASNSQLSSILTNKSDTNLSWSLPGVGANYEYASFRFLPSGETDLMATNTWVATLMVSTDEKSGAQLPANYATVRVDPVLGKVLVYRP